MFYLQLRYILLSSLLYPEEKLGVYGKGKQYIGCYLDQVERTIPYGKLSDYTMTNDMCVSHCCSFLGDAIYMGTEAIKECFCSNVTNTDNFIEMDPRNCDMPCTGNSSHICGGAWRISVYRIYCSTTEFVATTKQGQITTTSHISTLITEITTETTKQAGLESTTDKPQFDLQAGVASHYSVCSCADCLPSNNNIWTKEEIANKVTLLKNEISINKKETNLFRNTRRSVYDSRKSARNLGIVGIIVMMFPVICVVIIDILNILTVTQPVAVLQNEVL